MSSPAGYQIRGQVPSWDPITPTGSTSEFCCTGDQPLELLETCLIQTATVDRRLFLPQSTSVPVTSIHRLELQGDSLSNSCGSQTPVFVRLLPKGVTGTEYRAWARWAPRHQAPRHCHSGDRDGLPAIRHYLSEDWGLLSCNLYLEGCGPHWCLLS